MIPAELKKINDQVDLIVIDLLEITPQLADIIDKHIIEICEGASDSELKLVKNRFLKFLDPKDKRTQHGAVSEFFVHLYLKMQNYKQEFLFFNLEEGSIKKGFDGYFSKDNEEFIVESKSGSAISNNISHQNKINEAYDDIKSVVAGKSKKSKNNPWRNAYNHASHIDTQTKLSIRKKIKELSNLFDEGKFKNIEEFNIIPCSTIFLDGKLGESFSDSILNEKEKYFIKFKSKTSKILCTTKNSYDTFYKYLQEA